MTNSTDTKTADAKTANRKLTTTSGDGKWKTFLGVPGLMLYIPSGQYFARVKVNGIVKRASLGTDVFSTAKERLPRKVAELRKDPVQVGTFGDGRVKYEAETSNGYTSKKKRLVKLAPLSIAYRLRCLECLRRSLVESISNKTWKDLSEQARTDALTGLDAMPAGEITKKICDAWQPLYSDHYSASVFNNTVNTFRRVLELAGVPRESNPAYEIGRMDIVEKPIRLPRPEQFDRIITLIETSGAAQAKDCANLARFLAYSGCRISEAKAAVWSDVNWQENTLTIHSVKVRGSHDGSVTRVLPMNPALRELLEQLHAKDPKPSDSDSICSVFECQGALTRACKLAGVKRLVHHDLRHYFVTKCLQAGVGVFTLAKWIGHRDNGKLLLKVYAHLQAEHSQEQASLVQFGAAPMKQIAA